MGNWVDARMVINREIEAMQDFVETMDPFFDQAIELVVHANKVIITGVGKSGHVGRRMAATMTSLGIPALFMHATEAVHGDLGIVEFEDVFIALSHSGSTAEVVNVLNRRSDDNPAIGITSKPDSHIAQLVNVHIDTRVKTEADNEGFIPSSSCVVTAAIGDALAICAAKERGFDSETFKRFHPGGTLGQTL